MNKSFYKICVKSLLRFDGFYQKVLNFLAIKENGGIHPKHELTRYCDFFLANIEESDSVLDIGCGISYVANQAARKAKRVVGVDNDGRRLAAAKKMFRKDNLEFLLADATKYDFSQKYDAIILSNVLEHIEDRISFLKKIKPLSDKILIRVPMLDRDWLPLYKKQLDLFYFCDKTHYTEYTLETFKEEMTQAGLVIDKYSVQFGEIWAVVKVNH
ncbi:class I SAM-dependent methyltransferase [bacterium]|nr:MAG: class I SAM-dependent methyltransferase [bacterium]